MLIYKYFYRLDGRKTPFLTSSLPMGMIDYHSKHENILSTTLKNKFCHLSFGGIICYLIYEHVFRRKIVLDWKIDQIIFLYQWVSLDMSIVQYYVVLSLISLSVFLCFIEFHLIKMFLLLRCDGKIGTPAVIPTFISGFLSLSLPPPYFHPSCFRWI